MLFLYKVDDRGYRTVLCALHNDLQVNFGQKNKRTKDIYFEDRGLLFYFWTEEHKVIWKWKDW